MTQAQAAKQASTAGGLFGNKTPVKLKNEGMAIGGSGDFAFQQVSPVAKMVKGADGKMVRATDIQRFVSVSGKGERATATMLP